MGIIVIGKHPDTQTIRVVSDTQGVRLVTETGETFGSGFTDEADARRYLAAIAADPVGGEDHVVVSED